MHPWTQGPKPRGPIGLLLQSAFFAKAVAGEHFNIIQFNETPISITQLPYNHIKPLILDASMRANVSYTSSTRTLHKDLGEIDNNTLQHATQGLSREEHNWFSLAMNDAIWTPVKQANLCEDELASTSCIHCGHSKGDLVHLLWHCPTLSNVTRDPQACRS